MFKWLLISVVILPVLMGSQVAKRFRGPHGLFVLLGVFFVFCVAYVVMLHYLHHRWGAL